MAVEILGTSETRWPDADGPWALRLTFAIVDDRPGIVGVEMYAVDPEEIATFVANPKANKTAAEQWLDLPMAKAAGKMPTPIQSSAIRVPLGELLDRFLSGSKRSARIQSAAATVPPWVEDADEWRDAAQKRLNRLDDVTPKPGRPGRPTLYDKAHFEEVAKVYSAALRAGDPPTLAVMGHYQVTKTTAAKWVARARDLGLLRKTDRGKPAGRPSAKTTRRKKER